MTRRLLTQLRSISTSPLLSLDPPQTNLFQCNKRIQELAQLGQIEEAQKLFDEMSQRDSVTWNLLIDGYCRSGKIDKARALFDVFEGKNVRTWTTLLSGYAKNGRISEARSVFESMPVRNVVSWNAMISGYVQFGDLVSARLLFDQMGLRNIATWNSMITGYCRCHRMYEAKELFDQMWERNLVSWMVMISGYVECSCYREAWGLFVCMCRSDVRPDQAVFLAAVLAVTGLNDLVLIKCLHGVGSKMGFAGDVIVGTAILNAYTNVCLMSALNFFETMTKRNDYSWTTMIAAYAHHGRLDEAVAIFERVPEQTVSTRTAIMTAFAQNGRVQEARFQFDKIQNPNLVTWNAMLAGYAQNGMVEEAKDIFFKMPERNPASWAAMIAGLVQNGWDMQALQLLAELHRSGAIPNHSSFTSALFACANISAVEMGRQIHSLTIKTGCHLNTYVGNGLISMYGKAENKEDDSQDFSTMRMRETEDWDYLSAGLLEDSMLVDAHIVFDRMPKRDVVSWTSIISAYAQAGHGEIAFELFLDMMIGGMKPNELTMTTLLSACGSLGEKGLGGQVHALIFKSGFDHRLFVCNALIAMYFKCGCEDGFMVFQEMAQKDIVTWNSVLAGCAQNGFGKEAIKVFEQMAGEGVLPNHISFLEILCACSRAGLLDEGWAYFNSMSQDYGIKPQVYHYTCMVDLLGRAGHLSKAEALIKSMPIEPDLVIWNALLGACRVHRNMELGQRTAERLFDLGTRKSGTYVLLSNMYASQGMWDKVRVVREAMRDRGVRKEPGGSWIQIKNKLHCFLTGDKTHEQTEQIYSLLKELYGRLKAKGYVPDTNFVYHDVEDEQKQNELLYHSDKLAVAFAILNSPNGSTIRIMKNLRTCGDCHTFMKFVSKITGRKIVIRDGNRFHHFQDGLCSCGDYW